MRAARFVVACLMLISACVLLEGTENRITGARHRYVQAVQDCR